MTSAYGTIHGPDVISTAIVSLLTTWMPAYLAEVERQAGLPAGTLPEPRGYNPAITPSDPLPTCAITVPTIRGTQITGGTLHVTWGAGVGIAIASTTVDAATTLAGHYLTALLAVFAQHPDLGSTAVVSTDLGEGWTDPIAWDDARSVVAGTLLLDATIVAVDTTAGPATPPTPPTDPVTGIEITTHDEPITALT